MPEDKTDDAEFFGESAPAKELDTVKIGSKEDWAFLATKFVEACDGAALVHADLPKYTQFGVRFRLLDGDQSPHSVYFQFSGKPDADLSQAFKQGVLEFVDEASFSKDAAGGAAAIAEDAALAKSDDPNFVEKLDKVTDRMDEMIRLQSRYRASANSEHVARYVFEEKFASGKDGDQKALFSEELERRRSAIWISQSLTALLRQFLKTANKNKSSLASLTKVLDPDNKLELA